MAEECKEHIIKCERWLTESKEELSYYEEALKRFGEVIFTVTVNGLRYGVKAESASAAVAIVRKTVDLPELPNITVIEASKVAPDFML